MRAEKRIDNLSLQRMLSQIQNGEAYGIAEAAKAHGNRQNYIKLLALLALSGVFSVWASMPYLDFGGQGGTQIPVPKGMENFSSKVSGPASYGANLYLAFFLIERFFDRFTKIYKYNKLMGTDLKLSISKTKIVVKTVTSAIISSFGALPFYFLAEKDGLNLASRLVTFLSNVMQFSFGIIPPVNKLVSAKDENLDKIFKRSKNIRDKLISCELTLENNSNNLQLVRLLEDDHFDTDGTTTYRRCTLAPRIMTHVLFQAANAASLIGYYFLSGQSLSKKFDINALGVTIPLATIAMLGLTILGIQWANETGVAINKLLFAKTPEKKGSEDIPLEEKTLSTKASSENKTKENANTLLLNEDATSLRNLTCAQKCALYTKVGFYASLIAFGYATAFFSGSTALALNNTTSVSATENAIFWVAPIVTSLYFRLLTVIGSTIFNGFAIMNSIAAAKKELETRALPEPARRGVRLLTTLSQAIEFYQTHRTNNTITVFSDLLNNKNSNGVHVVVESAKEDNFERASSSDQSTLLLAKSP